MNDTRFFASDNCAPAHPTIVAALQSPDKDHHHGYGEDQYSRESMDCVRQLLAIPGLGAAGVHPACVLTGTAANIICLGSALRPGETVLCSDAAHITTDEGGAAEQVLGIKLQTLPAPDGRINPVDLSPCLAWQGSVHRSQVRMLSLSQTTELGTVYSPKALAALCQKAHAAGLLVHMDGSRLAQAVAAGILDRHSGATAADAPDLLAEARDLMVAMTSGAGIDLLALGGTKNGAMGVELILALDHGQLSPDLATWHKQARERMPFVQKSLMQLASKQRYLAAQVQALYGTPLWLENALAAVAATRHLVDGLQRAWPGKESPVALYGGANAVFLRLDATLIEAASQLSHGYIWDPAACLLRCMCSWDTRQSDVEALIEGLVQLETWRLEGRLP